MKDLGLQTLTGEPSRTEKEGIAYLLLIDISQVYWNREGIEMGRLVRCSLLQARAL